MGSKEFLVWPVYLWVFEGLWVVGAVLKSHPEEASEVLNVQGYWKVVYGSF